MKTEQLEKSQVKKEKIVAPENSWYDGEKYIPVAEMTTEHLRSAKLYAQRKAEYFWHKSSIFQEKIEMIEKEADARGVKLRNLKSSFAKNTMRRHDGYVTV